ncbi:EAL domain-containing protein [Sulfuritalea sp.]|uniref:EAL domain-containing protein n=1 Tax=Sulfuritalea sp. TaxID=2480090 RepID=UPI001AD31789|nr:EAL domain-containing protein [Sulfuritalea sp.]MBN8474486.1 EAL domain-containing protein [Sulfuritalea sp.]
MSMYRQLWLAIVLSMLLALGGSLFATLLSARAYLEQQLSMKNADNAAALALSLSQQAPDAVTLELTVAALFDSGHYEYIRILDPNGRIMVDRVAATGDAGAPEWFVRRLPIADEPGVAQITNGWKQLGSVSLLSHSRFAYQALWTSTQEMVAALALASFIGGYLGSLILRRLRRPLQAVIDQAVAITNRRFVTIPEPKVPELRKLASAMNATVLRLKSMFEEEAARLEAVRREANFDPLTGLANRDFFIAQLRSSVQGEDSTGGTLFLIRVADLVGINKRLGRAATDDLLRRVAETIGAPQGLPSVAGGTAQVDALAARMNGADFALLLPGRQAGREVAEALLESLVASMEAYVDGGPSAYIGMGTFKQGTGLRVLLSQVDAALIATEAEGLNAVREAVVATDDEMPTDGAEWGRIIEQALEQRWLRLVSFPVVDMEGGLLHVECPLRLKFDADGDWQPAGSFLPIAQRLGLAPQLDFAALELALESLEGQDVPTGLAINLAASSIAGANFRRKLDMLLHRHRKVASRLWVEVAETGVLKHVDAFHELCTLLRSHGCRVGVEHFGRQFSQIGQLHDLGLEYIKVDASFIRHLDTNPGNQAFLKGVSSIAHSIGTLVIAEGVANEAEFAALGGLGFDGATGPWVKLADAPV